MWIVFHSVGPLNKNASNQEQCGSDDGTPVSQKIHVNQLGFAGVLWSDSDESIRTRDSSFV